MLIFPVKYRKKVIFGINNNVGKRVIFDGLNIKETTPKGKRWAVLSLIIIQ